MAYNEADFGQIFDSAFLVYHTNREKIKYIDWYFRNYKHMDKKTFVIAATEVIFYFLLLFHEC